MANPAQLASKLKRALRYFRYEPPVGGFGGDFDILYAEAEFADDLELVRILEALGCPKMLPSREGDSGPANLVIEDVAVTLHVVHRTIWPGSIPLKRIRLTLGVYVTDRGLFNAQRVEMWLDARKIPMLPR